MSSITRCSALQGVKDAPYTNWGFGPTAIPGFGQVTPGYTTNFALDAGGSSGGQNPLYSVGGPRSGQLTVKITF